MDREAWWAIVQCCKELDMTEQLSVHVHISQGYSEYL